jgi:hypothetical protein
MIDIPGRERDLARLIAACTAARRGGAGRTIFVAGQESSGRSALLRSLAKHVGSSRPRTVVIAGEFAGGRYEAWDCDPAADARVVAALKRMGSTGEWISGLLSDHTTTPSPTA